MEYSLKTFHIIIALGGRGVARFRPFGVERPPAKVHPVGESVPKPSSSQWQHWCPRRASIPKFKFVKVGAAEPRVTLTYFSRTAP